MRKQKRPVRKKKKNRWRLLIFLSLFLCILVYAIIAIDKRMMPPVLAVAQSQITSRVNVIINNSVSKIISEKKIISSDFYTQYVDEVQKLNSFNINTVLINEFCGTVAAEISTNLHAMGREQVSLPLGSLFGVETLANYGPMYSVTILPVGEAHVDYETNFESAGINQIHFQIWLTVESRVRIINPMRSQEMGISRKVSLVDTIMSGEVPPVYLNSVN